MLKPMPLDENVELSFEVNKYLRSKTEQGFNYDMQVFLTRGRVRLVPSWKRRSPLLGWDSIYIDTDTIDPRIPQTLTDTSIAVGAGYPLGGNWILSATLGFGFAGDRPFNGRGWYGIGSISATKRYDNKKDFLQVGIDFDGNRPVFPDTPLPVIAWTRLWGEKLRTTLGFPFLGISWDPVKWLTFEFRGIPGIFQTGGFTFHVAKTVDVFVRYRGANFRFFLDNFPTDNRRLFYTEDRAELGITVIPVDRLRITFVAGWAFEREYSIGWDVRDTATLAVLQGTVFFGLTLSYTF